MKKIDLWQVTPDGNGEVAVEPVTSVAETSTEKHLEDVLVCSPEILMPGLVVIGRQTPTEGGPLDLLGVDPDGRLVVFELKRGTLTREAVAQVVDYGSYLHELEHEQLCRHIEERSGSAGVPKIDDFGEWYDEQFPGKVEQLEERPRLILVGLGADDRTRRMTEFLTTGGLDISLITFHAFQLDGKTLIARQTEVTSQKQRSAAQQSSSRSSNWQALEERLDKVGVRQLFETMRKVVKDGLPSAAYEWPNLSTYAYQLPDQSESGNPSYRVYVSIVADVNRPGQLGIAFLERATDLIPDELEQAEATLKMHAYWGGLLTWMTPKSWSENQSTIRHLLDTLTSRWQPPGDGSSENGTLGPSAAM